ncbi:MAG: single-stranded-DNA-specific exonuclease RecJ, partial [Bacteroidetes bacterium]
MVEQLSQEINVSRPIATLLLQRGITDFNSAKKFFRPSLENLHNPFLMKGMDLAVSRIKQAVSQNEKILFYGDYDVDGTTAVATMISFFGKIYEHVDFYIPDRYKEGYGVSFQGIDFAEEKGFSLIVTLDCGIKSAEKVEYAQQKGIDFIICDHHLPGEIIPPAVAVLDPKQPGCQYPYKELSGCGVGFKLAQAFALENNIPETYVYELIDLVAVSIACDIVPVTGENRVLAYYGLQKINKNPRRSIKALFETANLKKEITVSDLVFILGPRINAAGRIDHARKAVELLISENDSDAEQIAKLINEDNLTRKDLDAEITRQALQLIAENEQWQNARSLVLYQED